MRIPIDRTFVRWISGTRRGRRLKTCEMAGSAAAWNARRTPMRLCSRRACLAPRRRPAPWRWPASGTNAVGRIVGRLSTAGRGRELPLLESLGHWPKPRGPTPRRWSSFCGKARSALTPRASSFKRCSTRGAAGKYPEFGLAGKLKQIAQLIDAGLGTRIYYVSLDGFDTHSNQPAGHAALLGNYRRRWRRSSTTWRRAASSTACW